MNIKTDTTVVTERGQTSIPAHLRKEMGLQKGKRLVWEKVSDEEIRILVRPSAEADPVAMLGFARRFRRTRRTAAWMSDLRAGDE
jgi:AbrB family looped-hinge helix DNA binding protein